MKHPAPGSGGSGNACFPRPGAGRGPDQPSVPSIQRPALPGGGTGAGRVLVKNTAGPGPVRQGVAEVSASAVVRGWVLKHRHAWSWRDEETHAFPRPGASRGLDQQPAPVIQRPAPAMGGASAGRGLRGHGWSRAHAAGNGRGVSLCHGERVGTEASPRRVRADQGNARVPPPRRRPGPRSTVRSRNSETSVRPGGREAPAMGGAGAGRGLRGHGRSWTNRRGGRGVSLCHGRGGY